MESYEDQYTRLLNELEKIAYFLLKSEFSTIQELWQFELDIINYQSALQEAIAKEQTLQQEVKRKKTVILDSKPEDWKAQLQQCAIEVKQADDRIKINQHAYQLSRQVGDAFAWVLLSDWLIPLTKQPSKHTNDGHRLPKEHGLKGMLAIGEGLCNAGAGFPILHDITNCLCTGDITFYSPDKEHITIEVKTHFKGQEEGLINLDVEVHLAALADSALAEKWQAINNRLPKFPSLVSPEREKQDTHSLPRQPEGRLKRQIERMRQARIWQSVSPHQTVKLDERNTIIGIDSTQTEKTYHWEIVRDLVNKARADGIASCAVDNAFVYIAFYNDIPLSYPWSPQDVIQDLVRSSNSLVADTRSILYSEAEREKNNLWLSASTPPSGSLPFLLYPLPIEVIMDILWGRLTLSVIVNQGKVVAALEEIGLSVKVPRSEEEFHKSFLPIFIVRKLGNHTIKVELHQLHTVGLKMMHEFLSLQGFVGCVSEFVEGAEEQARKQMERAE